MRDRLIELLENMPRNKMTIGEVADYILANSDIVPLCKVGDTVYQVDTVFDEIIITELTVVELIIDSKGMRSLYGMTNKGSVYCFNRGHNLNNIKFTREEAERALKGGEPICDYTKTNWSECCECSAKDHCDKYNERSEIIGEMLGEVIGEIKNEWR